MLLFLRKLKANDFENRIRVKIAIVLKQKGNLKHDKDIE